MWAVKIGILLKFDEMFLKFATIKLVKNNEILPTTNLEHRN